MTQRKPIIAARRTDHLEALLQKLWTLRPVYKDKQAFTIAAGVAALIREIEYMDRSRGTVGPAAVPEVDTEVEAELDAHSDGADALTDDQKAHLEAVQQ
ncbi:MAG: hypothetical protein DCF15_20005 [Phormidesmis priestleyi]|uniref:Uncharacterized protein n=1 Tax=Phormidesmis priestleyi TaxID=268141 RepID=A0A2W4YUV3_9CYAN|nr:MAG: hypothetical protein DCF15_20005 [Phormidesmis priestleyi]